MINGTKVANRAAPALKKSLSKAKNSYKAASGVSGKEKMYSKMNAPRAAVNRFANKFMNNKGLTL